ncbi:UDP-N-acetylmuramoyl-L-alanine--D-glutamate ligase [Cardiobacteriaceae bacterium TAE3-ERU3]|nr:UDP-N-acetylmuramoyl-L-alanine--D-glutamate ligase [Cardiobacteriaceae bacterium TAE3-ERU3]
MNTYINRLRALNLAEPVYVAGMGMSGRSALDVLREAGYDAIGIDERSEGRHIQKVNFDDADLSSAATLVVSPGIDRRRGAFARYFGEMINDVELFARIIDKPVLAVTGSNGKSTVVTMLAEALRAVGKTTALCGNIGYPVLSALINDDPADVYVLELSSYQLELCPSLVSQVGCVLNVSPDHLDRYETLEDYTAAKANLVRQSKVCVLNHDDVACRKMDVLSPALQWFGANQINTVSDGSVVIDGEPRLRTDELTLKGGHNYANVVAVLIMLHELGLDNDAALGAVKSFAGLPHRMQVVREHKGVTWFNDSKATNTGATEAALSGINAPLLLILGGQDKNQDFSGLASLLKDKELRSLLLIGENNTALEGSLTNANLNYEVCHTLDKAVARARELAQSGDWVVLSPACASFDQFRGYAQRGEAFINEVNRHGD